VARHGHQPIDAVLAMGWVDFVTAIRVIADQMKRESGR